MSSESPENTPASIKRTRPQAFSVVIAASFAAALLLTVIACSPEPPPPTPKPIPTSTPTPRPTATREPLDPDIRYYLPGQAGNEFRIYVTAIAEGVPPGEADKDVEVWLMVREGYKGSDEMIDFLLTSGISENAMLVVDAYPCYIYVIAQVPVSLLRPLLEHSYLLILTLGPATSPESLNSEPTASTVAPIQKPICLPPATPQDGAAGTAELLPKSLHGSSIFDEQHDELEIYLTAVADGTSPEDADKTMLTWIALRGPDVDASIRAVSEYLLAHEVSKDSIRPYVEDHMYYVLAAVPVSLFFPLSNHPNVSRVGGPFPTEAEKEAPTGSAATPAPTPSDAAILLPTATPSDGAVGTVQEPFRHLNQYKISGRPLEELRIYATAVADGASPEDIDKDVEAWILVGRDNESELRAVSEFLLSNGVSEDSLRPVRGQIWYVVAQVPVSLLIRLSQLQDVTNVGDRIPTEIEKEAPTGSAATPASTPSDAVKWHRADSWHNAGFKGQGIKIGIIDTNCDSFSTHHCYHFPRHLLRRNVV